MPPPLPIPLPICSPPLPSTRSLTREHSGANMWERRVDVLSCAEAMPRRWPACGCCRRLFIPLPLLQNLGRESAETMDLTRGVSVAQPSRSRRPRCAPSSRSGARATSTLSASTTQRRLTSSASRFPLVRPPPKSHLLELPPRIAHLSFHGWTLQPGGSVAVKVRGVCVRCSI